MEKSFKNATNQLYIFILSGSYRAFILWNSQLYTHNNIVHNNIVFQQSFWCFFYVFFGLASFIRRTKFCNSWSKIYPFGKFFPHRQSHTVHCSLCYRTFDSEKCMLFHFQNFGNCAKICDVYIIILVYLYLTRTPKTNKLNSCREKFYRLSHIENSVLCVE